MPRILALLRALQPDVLVTSNWGSMEWAVARLPLRIPHMHTEDGFGPDESAGQKPRRMLARRLLLRRSTVVLPSDGLLRVARDLWHLPPARLRHIPNGMDLRRFRPDGPAPALDVPGEGPLVGTVAALRPEKNLGRLLRAAALLRREGTPLRLAILGDGEERPGLEALTAELGLADSVRFLGAVADPSAAYRALDVFALTSDTEQMPFSVLEAMASARPVTATDVGDVAVMLGTEARPYVAPAMSGPEGDAAMAAAMRPLLQDPELRTRLGASNRARAEQRYDEEAMFAAYAALLDTLAARRGA